MLPIRFIRTYTSGQQREIVKFYYDFKSPYTYLALEPALELEKEYPIQLRFIPWAFRPEESFGGNLQERNRLNWNKTEKVVLQVRLSSITDIVIHKTIFAISSRLSTCDEKTTVYPLVNNPMDCRRFANERGMIIRGPERLFDSRLSLIGGLYADKHNFFSSYARLTFERFFKRQLNLENLDEITKLLYETSNKNFSHDFQTYFNNQGGNDYLNAQNEADQDNIFGVPTFVVRGEPFWGYDRISWVKKKLDSLQLHDT